jgi:predicted ATPase
MAPPEAKLPNANTIRTPLHGDCDGRNGITLGSFPKSSYANPTAVRQRKRITADESRRSMGAQPRSRTDRFFVITGGPGSGKTTLIEALARVGFAVSVEAGRGVIQNQTAIGGRALPWCDPAAFAELMLSWEMRSYRSMQPRTGPVFFDRSVPDAIGYLQLMGGPVPPYMQKAATVFRYNRQVFVASPWPEIFEPDEERKQDSGEAVRTCEMMKTVYGAYGHALIELPRVGV